MEKTIYSVDDKVDYYLHKIAMAPALRLDPRELYEVQVLDEEAYLIDQVMLERGLIKIERDSRVITSTGLEISNFGGWALHQKLLIRDRGSRMPKEEIVIDKYEAEIRQLKARVIELENETQLRKDKELTAFRILDSITKQAKADRLYYLLGGIITGFIAALLLLIFIR
jgi:hypothetical protein